MQKLRVRRAFALDPENRVGQSQKYSLGLMGHEAKVGHDKLLICLVCVAPSTGTIAKIRV